MLLRAWKNLLLCNSHDKEGDDRYRFSGCGHEAWWGEGTCPWARGGQGGARGLTQFYQPLKSGPFTKNPGLWEELGLIPVGMTGDAAKTCVSRKLYSLEWDPGIWTFDHFRSSSLMFVGLGEILHSTTASRGVPKMTWALESDFENHDRRRNFSNATTQDAIKNQHRSRISGKFLLWLHCEENKWKIHNLILLLFRQKKEK